jgi:hypothetical protein
VFITPTGAATFSKKAFNRTQISTLDCIDYLLSSFLSS